MGAVELGVGLHALVVGNIRILKTRFRSRFMDLGSAAGGLGGFQFGLHDFGKPGSGI